MEQVRPIPPATALEPEAINPRRGRRRRGLIWAGVLLAAFGMGVWVTDPLQVAPRPFAHPAKLVIAVQPETPFSVRVSKTPTAEESQTFPGSKSIALPPGDYYVDVLPLVRNLSPKKLRVHLSVDQTLALPVMLTQIQALPGQDSTGP